MGIAAGHTWTIGNNLSTSQVRIYATGIMQGGESGNDVSFRSVFQPMGNFTT